MISQMATHLSKDTPVALFSVSRSVDMYIRNDTAFSTPVLSGEYNMQVWAHSDEHAAQLAMTVMADMADKYDLMWSAVIHTSRFTEWGIVGDEPVWLDEPVL